MSTWGWVCIGALVVLNLQWRIADVERTLLQQVQMGGVYYAVICRTQRAILIRGDGC